MENNERKKKKKRLFLYKLFITSSYKTEISLQFKITIVSSSYNLYISISLYFSLSVTKSPLQWKNHLAPEQLHHKEVLLYTPMLAFFAFIHVFSLIRNNNLNYEMY